ncbi:hypothetical protein CASFOL_021142 [Castilleja foliolosa]|uniref:TF-B3 domain-containing protein n=1 Tax=Castilleja foliolosa TaxID=1961234 RepID=A0ABD3CZU4_9LAMI
MMAEEIENGGYTLGAVPKTYIKSKEFVMTSSEHDKISKQIDGCFVKCGDFLTRCSTIRHILSSLKSHEIVVVTVVQSAAAAESAGPAFAAKTNAVKRYNFPADPPVQNLIIKDAVGNAWEFRHIYRGTPRCNSLTTGWSKFVNAKLLVAGDTVIFMRKNK